MPTTSTVRNKLNRKFNRIYYTGGQKQTLGDEYILSEANTNDKLVYNGFNWVPGIIYDFTNELVPPTPGDNLTVNPDIAAFKAISLGSFSRGGNYTIDFFALTTGPDNYSMDALQFRIYFNDNVSTYVSTTEVFGSYTYLIDPPGPGFTNRIDVIATRPANDPLVPKLLTEKLLTFNMQVKADAPTGSQILINKVEIVSILNQGTFDYVDTILQDVNGEKRAILSPPDTLRDYTKTIT